MLKRTDINITEKKIVEWHEEEYHPKSQLIHLPVPEMITDAVYREGLGRMEKAGKNNSKASNNLIN